MRSCAVNLREHSSTWLLQRALALAFWPLFPLEGRSHRRRMHLPRAHGRESHFSKYINSTCTRSNTSEIYTILLWKGRIRNASSRLLSPSFAAGIHLRHADWDKGKKNCSPIQKQITSIFLLSCNPNSEKCICVFAGRCRFAPWSSGPQPPPWPRRRACWGCQCPPVRFGTWPQRPTTRS